MKFAEPSFLWLLGLLPVFWFLFTRDVQVRKKTFTEFASKNLWNVLSPSLDYSRVQRKHLFWVISFLFFVLTLARPQWGQIEKTLDVSGLDIVVALDISNSMEVEDVVPSRLKKAKHFIRSLTKKLAGDRIGVVAFAASSYLASPLTSDLDYVMETVDALGPNMAANQGTDIGLALETAAGALDRGSEEGENSSEEKESSLPASKVVVLISDGEDLEQRAAEGVQKIRDLGASFFVFGVGTEKGGPIPLRDDSGQLLTYKKDFSGNAIVSRFSDQSLRSIAQKGGGRYWTISSQEGEIDEMLKDLGALNRTEFSERTYFVYQERFQYPLFIGLFFLLLSISLSLRKVASLGAALFLFCLQEGRANTSFEAYLENQSGLEEFEAGNFGQAKRHFDQAQKVIPKSPELFFNQGMMELQQKDLDSAITEFDSAARESLRRNNSDIAGKSLYNLGSAFEKKGNFENAIKSYLAAIEQAKNSKDETLEKNTRGRLEKILEKRQKQKQKQNQQQKDSDQKQGQKDSEQQNSSQQANSDQKSPQKKNQKQNQSDKGGQRKPRPYQSEKLSKDAADQVMAELSNRERELQKKLKKQKGRANRRGKDW